MARPRIPIGTFGEIGFLKAPGGGAVARTAFATGTASAGSCR